MTNQMGRIEGDFEKGSADGAQESLRAIALTAARRRSDRGINSRQLPTLRRLLLSDLASAWNCGR